MTQDWLALAKSTVDPFWLHRGAIVVVHCSKGEFGEIFIGKVARGFNA